MAAEESARGGAIGPVPVLAVAGAGAAERLPQKASVESLQLEESDTSPRSDCRAHEPRRGVEAASTAATTTRTDSSPCPSECSSGASEPLPDGARDFPQQPLTEGGEEAPPGPLFEGTWEDEDGDSVRLQGTTLHGPDGDLDVTQIDERSFTVDTGLETFKATVAEDGRLVWGDGSAWTRKEQLSVAEGEQATQQDAAPAAEEKPPEQRLGTKVRWAFVTKDLHLFLASAAAASVAHDPGAVPADAPAGEAPAGEAPAAEAPAAGAPAAAAPAAEGAQTAEGAPALDEVRAAEGPGAAEEAASATALVEPSVLSTEVPQTEPLAGEAEPEVAGAEALTPEEQALAAEGAEAEATPLPAVPEQLPLDPPPARLSTFLEPMRAKLQRSIGDKLEKYDSSYRYPRPEDVKTATRDGYEEHLRTEGLKELRTAMRKEYNYGATGQVWKVVGGKSCGGIIARVDDEVRSDKTDTRLAEGALIEELTMKEERLKYRLISGSGPESAWVTTRVKAGFTGSKDLAVRIPPEAAPISIIMLGLMAAHIRTQARLDRFCHVLRSVQKQRLKPDHAQFLFAVSWSSTPELSYKVQSALEEFVGGKDSAEGGSTGAAMFAVQQVERHSQFQHLKAALALAEGRLRERVDAEPADGRERSVWVLFGDDDDIWHSCRVAEYVGAIRAHTMLDGVGVFVTTARVNCHENKRLADKDMPVTEEQVDTFMKEGKGVRMDKKEECTRWKTQLRSSGHLGNCQPVPVDCGLEYFDLCPRLRLVHEFFGKTSHDFLTHRYCDLTFNEFLTAYPLQGREWGLEVAVFFPSCWMLFYATPIPDEKAWKGSVENGTDANNGHMSSTYSIEPIERELARRSLEDFQEFQAITEEKLTRYWAAYRAQLECYLVRKRGYKVDQRIFDCIVFLAMNGSFFDFWDAVRRKSKFRQEAAYEMMCYISQGFAKTIAAELLVDVLWLRPHLFLEPEMDGQGKDQHHHGYAYGAGWYPPGAPYGYSKGPFGKSFTGPWGFSKGAGKGLGKGFVGNPLGLNKPFGGKGSGGKGGQMGHSPVFFSPYSNSKTSHFHKK